MIHLFRINKSISSYIRTPSNRCQYINYRRNVYKRAISNNILLIYQFKSNNIRAYCNNKNNAESNPFIDTASEKNDLSDVTYFTDLRKVELYFGKDLSSKNSSSLNPLLVDLILKKDYEELEKTFFSNINKKDSMKPDNLSFAIMLNYYCTQNQIAIAGNTFKLMKNLGIKPNALCLNCFMEMHRRSGSREGVIKWYNKFKEEDVMPTLVTYKILLTSYTKIEPIDTKGALKCFEEILNENVIIDAYMYAIIIEMYENLNNIDEAINWVNKLNNAKFDNIDNETRLIVLKVHEKLAQQRKAESFRSYNKLLQEYSERNEVKKALDVWEEMKKKGVEYDSMSYGYIIQLYSKVGDSDKAIEFYDVMISKQLVPDRITLTAMLKVFSKIGDHERYKEIYNRIQSIQ